MSSVQEVTDDSDDPTDDPNTFVVTEVTTLAKIFFAKTIFLSELRVLLTEKTTPVSVRTLLPILEKIENNAEHDAKPPNVNKTKGAARQATRKKLRYFGDNYSAK